MPRQRGGKKLLERKQSCATLRKKKRPWKEQKMKLWLAMRHSTNQRMPN